jgi:hypothetical protein
MYVKYDFETKIVEINLESINIKAAATDWVVQCFYWVSRSCDSEAGKQMGREACSHFEYTDLSGLQ